MADTDISSTIGAMFIGVILGTALWGVCCVQAWFYFDNYRTDPKWQKCLVALAWTSDTVHQILVIHAVYYYTIKYYSDVDHLKLVVWSVYAEVLMNAITGLLVQSFFLHRIWQLRRNWLLLLLIGSLVAAEFVTSATYFIQGLARNLDTYAKLQHLKSLSITVNVLAAAGDITISASICTMLSASKTGFAWSNHVINRLMLFSINTGLLTSICAVGSLISILAFPNTFAYFAFYFIIGRFYLNSLLANLNVRKRLLRGSGHPSNGESHSLQDRTAGFRVAKNPRDRVNTEVQVQIETIREFGHENSNDMEAQSRSNSVSENQKTVSFV